MKTMLSHVILGALVLGCTTEFRTGADADTHTTDTISETDGASDTGGPDTVTDVIPDTAPDPLVDTPADTAPDPVADTAPDPDAVMDTVPDAPFTCDRDGFDPALQSAYRNESNFFYQAQSSNAYPRDVLTIEFYYGFGDPPPLTEPGTFAIGETSQEQNYQTCGTCLLIRTECTATDGCDKIFFATGGEVTLYEFGEAPGEPVAGDLIGVTYVEVTIDESTYVSTPVPGGEGWCIDTLTFEVELIDP